MNKNNYYKAYDDRYKIIHQHGLLWSTQTTTPELIEWINYYNIPKNNEILEIGCGEGRDSLYLNSLGYKITAIDVSETAIKKSIELDKYKEINWIVDDILNLAKLINKKFSYIFSIATLHMLVLDRDRKKFLKNIYNLLNINGKLLLVNMYNNKINSITNKNEAFNLVERKHQATGKIFLVPQTSFCNKIWDDYKIELENNKFIIEKKLNTVNENYNECITVYLTKCCNRTSCNSLEAVPVR